MNDAKPVMKLTIELPKKFIARMAFRHALSNPSLSPIRFCSTHEQAAISSRTLG
jgi:hypothetical protein